VHCAKLSLLDFYHLFQQLNCILNSAHHEVCTSS
jgi:hypothetical protein